LGIFLVVDAPVWHNDAIEERMEESVGLWPLSRRCCRCPIGIERGRIGIETAAAAAVDTGGAVCAHARRHHRDRSGQLKRRLTANSVVNEVEFHAFLGRKRRHVVGTRGREMVRIAASACRAAAYTLVRAGAIAASGSL